MVEESAAKYAAEKGITRLVQNFDPQNLGASAQTTVAADLAVDTYSRYQIEAAVESTIGPEFVPIQGFNIGGAQVFGLKRYNSRVRGINMKYNTSVSIDAGLGFGPVDMGTGGN